MKPIQVALAEMRGIKSLVIQANTLYHSTKLLCAEISDLTLGVGVDDDMDDINVFVYEKTKGIDDYVYSQPVTPRFLEFVEYVKTGDIWLLCLKVSIKEDTGDTQKYSFISMNSDSNAVQVLDNIVKEDWLVSL